MKPIKLLIASALLLSAACIDADEPNEPQLEESSQTSEGSPWFAPVCGEGPIEYFEWVCHWGYGWQLDVVGYREFNCTAPYMEALVGRETRCAHSTREVCGGGADDEEDGSTCTYWMGYCPPEPSSYCPVSRH